MIPLNQANPTRASRAAATLVRQVLISPFVCWNWKTALISLMIRSTAYFILVARHGHHAGLRAAAVEAAYVALTAGIYSGLQQRAVPVRPRWLSNLTVVVVVPMLAQTVDWATQRAMHTPNLKAATIGMVFWGLLSASFHLHMMRNGAMLVGPEGRSFGNDMKRVPWMVATFVATPFRLCLDAAKSVRTRRLETAETELVA